MSVSKRSSWSGRRNKKERIMKIDITKGGAENALALVNFTNPGINLPLEKVMFDTVTAEVSNDGTHNTKARVVAQEGKGLDGHVFVTYYRPGLLEQTDLPSVKYTATHDVTADALLERICTELELVKDDVVWQSYLPGAIGDVTVCVLSGKPDSLLYQGAVDLQITWE